MFIDVAPYFIGATLFSAILETKFDTEKLMAPILKGRFAIVWASVLGGLLPGCACATVPLAENLRKSNAGLGVTEAFLLVSPLLAPHTIILTYGFLGIKFTVGRIIASMTGAILLGYIFHLCKKRKLLKMPDFEQKNYCVDSGCSNESVNKGSLLQTFWSTTKTLGFYFLIGIFIASALTVWIPSSLIPTYIGTGFLAYLIAAIIVIPVYACEGEEIPITKGLLALQLGNGPAFSFMLGAVGTCIPTILMSRKLIGTRAILAYILYWFIFVVVSGLGFSMWA
ncbi:MAG: hypothetical protein CL687_05130 [Candidatus Pelagibacter sp.]|nr:hypothetical protein [Candidatus Pelagibacter sp.]OUV96079.1 MAG: hypothetical protein CBD02_05390 [Candidatus Pelagibacter sp. TMED142]|tara:strand:+ start:1053 stop:1898 length:846 start_codon:yes stop_codon:yes gene_type:complete